jgi:hypothetical protein
MWVWALRGDSGRYEQPAKKLPLPDTRTMFGFLLILSASLELAKKQQLSFNLPKQFKSPIFGRLRTLLAAKINGNLAEGEAEAEKLGFRAEERMFIRRWLNSEIKLVSVGPAIQPNLPLPTSST